MTAWRAAQAKAQFSEMLDRAETEGPQLVQRRKQQFLLMKKEDHRMAKAQPPQRSAWQALRPPDHLLVDDNDFPRMQGEARAAEF